MSSVEPPGNQHVLICILCPNSCRIKVGRSAANGTEATTSGAGCQRGRLWAIQESICPLRTLTTSILVRGGTDALASVRTDREIPFSQFPIVLKVLHHLVVAAPVAPGDVIATNPAGIECRIVATREVPAAEEPISKLTKPKTHKTNRCPSEWTHKSSTNQAGSKLSIGG